MSTDIALATTSVAVAFLSLGCASRVGVWPPPEDHLQVYSSPSSANPELYRALMPVMRTLKVEGDSPGRPVWVFYPPPQYIKELVGEDRLAECTRRLEAGDSSCWVKLSVGVGAIVFRDVGSRNSDRPRSGKSGRFPERSDG